MSKFDGILSVKPNRSSTRKSPKSVVKGKSDADNTKSRTPGKRSDPDYTQITAYIRKDTHETVMRKIYKRQEFSELLEELLTEWMKNAK